MAVRTHTLHRLLGLVLGGVLIGGCGAPPTFDRSTLPDRWADADRVVLLEDVTVRFVPFEGEPVAEVSTLRRVWYRTPQSIENVTVGIGHQPGLRDLLAFEGRVFPPEGESTAFGREDAVDVPSIGGGTIFSDSRYLRHRLSLVPGSVVETRSTVRYHDVRLRTQSQAFGGFDPAERRRLTVHLPPGWQSRHLAREDGAPIEWAPRESTAADGGRVLVWSRERIDPLPRERHAPSVYHMAPRVSVQLARWQIDGRTLHGPDRPEAVSALMHRLQAPRRQPDDALRAQVDALLEGVGDDPRARAATLHAFVRDRIRYVSVQLGMGGWIPYPSAEVLDVGYGDCKAQAALLGSMLTVAGIPNRQVTVFSHRGWPLPYGLPTIAGNSNHQVVLVDLPDGPVVADPTQRNVAFGDVPRSLVGAPVLPLTADGDPVETLPVPAPEANRLEVTLTLNLSQAGGLKGDVEVRASGDKAAGIRHHLRTEKGKERHRKLADWFELDDMAVDAPKHEAAVEPTTADVPLVLGGRVWTKRSIGSAGQLWTIAPGALVNPGIRRIDIGERTRPIVLGAPRLRLHRLNVKLPAGREAGALPPPVEISTPFADYRLTWTATDDGFSVERRLVWRQPWLPPTQADAYRAFARDVKRADLRPVTLRPAKPAAPSKTTAKGTP